ncbi:MFS transporter [Amycolatopsis sp. OK19-0408]|uniref:MFS transporter n=1 Tax=Amycolatopsis iheyensis TaxID=2945988 RepID=A0A9X2NEU5_9PSEU|nr:MFS transporter [Amycolatopsis iheyensis]MCR6487394.1 MFS transporter [Amycolatopsis iheyensis]
MATDASESRPSPPTRFGARRWLVLIMLCASQFMVALDFSIVSVALPTIGRDLGFSSTADLQWVMTAFILFIAGFLLLFGRASDLFGRRRLFLIGVALFTVFSLAGGLADTPWLLILARAGQGIGAAMVGPAAMSLLTTSFREGPERQKALSVNGAVLMLGFIVGVISGGIITGALSWRWTMLLLAIIGAIVFVAALALLEESKDANAARLDVPGAVLATAGILSLVYGISTGDSAGWDSPATIGTLAGGVVLLGLFLFAESRHPAPLAPLDVLRRRSVKWGGLAGFITFGMCGGATVLETLYMQDVLGWSPLRTGLSLIPLGGSAVIGGLIGNKVIGALGVPRALVCGLLLQAVATGLMTLLPEGGDFALLIVTNIGLGFGHVTAVIAFNITVTSGLPNDKQGLAGGLAQTAQQLGSAVWLPVLAAVVTARTASLQGSGTTVSATTGGLHAGLLTAGLIALFGALVATIFLRGRQTATATAAPVTAGVND